MGNGICTGVTGTSSQPNSPTAPAGRGPTSPHRGFPPATPAAPNAFSPGGDRTSPPAAPATPQRPSPPPPPPAAPTNPSPSAAAPNGTPDRRVPLMSSTPADRRAAEELKAQGNALFAKEKYAAAMEKYTEAITLCPQWAVLYINRGMASRKRGDWERVEADAGAALALVGGSGGEREAMKGHYLLGLAMSARGQHDRSTHHLRKALDAAREANDSIKDEIWRELATAKYQHWQALSGARRAQAKQLRRQLADLMGIPGGQGGPNGEPQLPAEWSALFSAAAWQDTAVEAPSQFTCPLTMEVFRDPVVVPSGRSYERSALLEHLKKVGRFDPVTRAPLSEEQLVANVSLRAAVEAYLEEHPWAWGEVK